MTAFGQGNPLFSNEETGVDSMIEITLDTIRDVNEIPTDTLVSIDSNSRGLLLRNTKIQKEIREYIAQLSHRLKDEGDGLAIFWILLFSFLYGIAHSLGPGHNKVVVFSYFLSEKPKIKDGIIMGNLAAFIHALSGLTVALVILFVIKETTSSTFDQSELTHISMLISFGMIVFIGGFMLYHNITNYRIKSHDIVSKPSLKVLPMAFAVGIIPCPGTIILVTFLATMGFLKLSIFVIAMVITLS
jgi:ABC-type nickel/cobalt efflux system permease component RcnA